jgi:hypothetical protein
MGDTEDRNEVFGQWYNEWSLDTWVDARIFRSLRDTFLPILVMEPAKYSEPDEDEASNEALLHEPESNKSLFPPAPPPQKAELIYPLPG